MWINMNEDTLGYTVVFTILFLFFILPAFIGRRFLLKARAAEEKKRLEAQEASRQNEPAMAHKPASPRRSVGTLIVMTVFAIIWSLMVGFVVGVFSHLIYIVFLIPLVMGLNNGKMIVEVVQKAKIRTFSHLVVLSAISAIVMYGTFHYTRYLGFQIQASLEIYSGFSEALEEENLRLASTFVDYALEEETGHSGFLGYMLYRASEGISISRLSRSSGLDLGPALTWLYWLVEFGIILGLTIHKGRTLIGASFCESCGNWYGMEKHLGGTASANESFLLDLIRQKDFSELGKLIEQNAEVPSLEVYFQGCQICGKSPSQLVVRHAFQSAKGTLQFTETSQTVLQPNESVSLLSQLSFSGD